MKERIYYNPDIDVENCNPLGNLVKVIPLISLDKKNVVVEFDFGLYFGYRSAICEVPLNIDTIHVVDKIVDGCIESHWERLE